MRIVKSAIAVWLCFVIDLLRGDGMPFYSAIAAVLCMQPNLANSIAVAGNRVAGTLLGGVCGMGVLLLARAFLPANLPILQYLLVSVALIPLIYLTVLMKNPSASYITCVVFMSVAISHGADVNPYLFALNRVLDTLIGIGVSLAVNSVHRLRRRDLGLLYVAHLERSLAGGKGEISVYGKTKLNQMLDCGAQIAVVSEESPERFLPMLEGVQLRLPVVAFGGAALYHTATQSYSNAVTIPRDTVRKLEVVFAERGRGCFVGAVLYDVLHVFYSRFANQLECDDYELRRKSIYRHYVCSTIPEGHDAIFVSAIERTSAAEALQIALEKLPCADGLAITTTPYTSDERWSRLEVRATAATPAYAVALLQEQVRLADTQFLDAGEGDAPIRALARRFYRGKEKAPKPDDAPLPADVKLPL